MTELSETKKLAMAVDLLKKIQYQLQPNSGQQFDILENINQTLPLLEAKSKPVAVVGFKAESTSVPLGTAKVTAKPQKATKPK